MPQKSVLPADTLPSESTLIPAYLRFLKLISVFQFLPDDKEMDANELALLEAVVLRWHDRNPMTVREAIGLEVLGSPATLHKRITRLRDKQLLNTLNREGDRRAKFLVPSDLTLEYLSKLGHFMQQALSQPIV